MKLIIICMPLIMINSGLCNTDTSSVYFKGTKRTSMVGFIRKTVHTSTTTICGKYCLQDEECNGFDMKKDENSTTLFCQLKSVFAITSLEYSTTSSYYSKVIYYINIIKMNSTYIQEIKPKKYLCMNKYCQNYFSTECRYICIPLGINCVLFLADLFLYF